MRRWLIVALALGVAACTTWPTGSVSIRRGGAGIVVISRKPKAQPSGDAVINRLRDLRPAPAVSQIPAGSGSEPALPAGVPTPEPTDTAPSAAPLPAPGVGVGGPTPTPGAGGPTPTPTPGAGGPTPTPTPGAGGPTPTPNPLASFSVPPFSPTPRPLPTRSALPPSPTPTPTVVSTPTPAPTPTPMVGPVSDGVWKVTVTTSSGPQDIYYRLHCLAGNSMRVNDGAISQDFTYAPAQPGWSAVHVNFSDTCDLINGVTWCIYYKFDTVAPTTMSGTVLVVGDGVPITFPATATWLYL